MATKIHEFTRGDKVVVTRGKAKGLEATFSSYVIDDRYPAGDRYVCIGIDICEAVDRGIDIDSGGGMSCHETSIRPAPEAIS